MFWLVLFVVAIIAMVAGMAYVIRRLYKLDLIERISKGNKKLRIAIASVIVMGLCAAGYLSIGLVNTIIVVVYALCLWLVVDLILFLVERKKGKKINYNIAVIGITIAIAGYFGWGWYQAHNVVATRYTVNTSKAVENLRVVQITDSHVGTTFDGDGFAREIEKIQKENPDVVVVTGDFVDDDTPKEDMIKASQALGKLKSKYGTYFVFGNHDKGYSNSSRGYDGDEVVRNLEANGVKVLQDETVLIGDNYYLVGRKDKSEESMGSGRASMSDLVQSLDSSKYQIVLDHQPGDYKNQEQSGVDLVLSGHTHGGQMIPMNYFVGALGGNDMVYGIKKSGNTTFEVSSGISDWAVKFKTGCKSEYVVIDIQK